jgi:hypothetical protein
MRPWPGPARRRLDQGLVAPNGPDKRLSRACPLPAGFMGNTYEQRVDRRRKRPAEARSMRPRTMDRFVPDPQTLPPGREPGESSGAGRGEGRAVVRPDRCRQAELVGGRRGIPSPPASDPPVAVEDLGEGTLRREIDIGVAPRQRRPKLLGSPVCSRTNRVRSFIGDVPSRARPSLLAERLPPMFVERMDPLFPILMNDTGHSTHAFGLICDPKR